MQQYAQEQGVALEKADLEAVKPFQEALDSRLPILVKLKHKTKPVFVRVREIREIQKYAGEDTFTRLLVLSYLVSNGRNIRGFYASEAVNIRIFTQEELASMSEVKGSAGAIRTEETS